MPSNEKANPGQNLLRIAQAALDLRQFTRKQLADAAGVDIADVTNATKEGGLLYGRLKVVNILLQDKRGRPPEVMTFKSEDDYQFVKQYVASYLVAPKPILLASSDRNITDARRYLELAKQVLYLKPDSRQENSESFQQVELYLDACWETAALDDDILSLTPIKRELYSWSEYYHHILAKSQKKYDVAITGFLLLAKNVSDYNVDVDLRDLALFQSSDCLENWFLTIKASPSNKELFKLTNFLHKLKDEHRETLFQPVLIKISDLNERISRLVEELKTPSPAISEIKAVSAPTLSAIARLKDEEQKPSATRILSLVDKPRNEKRSK